MSRPCQRCTSRDAGVSGAMAQQRTRQGSCIACGHECRDAERRYPLPGQAARGCDPLLWRAAALRPHRGYPSRLRRQPSRCRRCRRGGRPAAGAGPGRDAVVCPWFHAVLDAGEPGRGPAARRRRRRGGPGRRAAAACRRGRLGRRRLAAAGQGTDRSGAHGASHRGDAQEHARPSQSHRGADGAARQGAGRNPGRGRDRAGAAAADRAAVADAAFAPGTHAGTRRGGDRARLPARCVHAGAAAALCALGPAAAAARGLVPEAGQLDRRRPRWQPERGRRQPALRARRRVAHPAGFLPSAAARARQGTVGLDGLCAGQ